MCLITEPHGDEKKRVDGVGWKVFADSKMANDNGGTGLPSLKVRIKYLHPDGNGLLLLIGSNKDH